MQVAIKSNARGLGLLIVLGRDLVLAGCTVGAALMAGAWLQSLGLN